MCLTRSVYVLVMTSQSIVYSALWDPVIVIQARDKWSLTL